MKQTAPVLLLRITKKNKFENLKNLLKTQWLSISEIRELQNRKFVELIRHCKNNVSYFRTAESIEKVESLSDISKLPFLTKKVISDNMEALKADNCPRGRFVLNSTSGSSGETLKFFSDSANNINLGILFRNNMWTGWNIGEKQAMLWGAHHDISKAKKAFGRIKNWFIYRTLYLSSFDMTEKNMYVYWHRINRYKPELITGYPSGLFAFASYLKEEGLPIYRPKGIICSGENMYQYQREKIEDVFECKTYNRYGCREVANIAHECEKSNGLHINSEHIIVEVVDEHGNLCRAGELGEIVVTDLDNYVFPFIRYKIGDVGILTERICDCGRGLPMIDKVEGRIFDIVVGTNGNRVTGNYWTILLRTLVKGVQQFQVVQEKQDTLLLNLVVDEYFDDSSRGELIRKIHEQCGKGMNVSINIVENIPLTASGKRKFVISNVSPFRK